MREIAIVSFAVVCCAMGWPFAAVAQQGAACSSPAFEKRLIAAIVKGEPALKPIPADKLQDYARCYARTACAKLTKVEFEMYALSQITSYSADDKAEKEYLGRMRRDRKANDAGGEKLPPKELEDTCRREAGLN